jgi:hypothetical protein
MRVGQNDGVYSLDRYWKFCPVLEAQCLESLKQAAIHKNACVSIFDEKFGAGDRASAAEEGNS